MGVVNVLLIGNGSREAAMLYALRKNPAVNRIFYIPTTSNSSFDAQVVNYKPTDFSGMCDFVREQKIDFTIVGPESPLVGGIVNYFHASGIQNIFGPSQEAAMLEGSKVFAKQFMARNHIPTAEDFKIATNREQANISIGYFIDTYGRVVVKADGLYAGKGVFVCNSRDEALEAAEFLFSGKNTAGHRIILEEVLEGVEASVFAFSDGKTVKMIPIAARDYKRAYDNDNGPNTGGMGAVAPVDIDLDIVASSIMIPAIKGMAAAGTPYKGVLFAGVMYQKDKINAIEFNCRLGDPEAQVILPLMKTDLVEVLEACMQGRLDEVKIEMRHNAACAVVLASVGYPGDYKTGFSVEGLDNTKALVFPGAMSRNRRTTGGRVLTVVDFGDTIAQARSNVYAHIGLQGIHFEGMYNRADIGVGIWN